MMNNRAFDSSGCSSNIFPHNKTSKMAVQPYDPAPCRESSPQLHHSPGDDGTSSRAYWEKMFGEGFVDELQTDAGEVLKSQITNRRCEE